MYAVGGEMEAVNSGACVQFQQMVPWMHERQRFPSCDTSDPSNDGISGIDGIKGARLAGEGHEC